jgi:coiled-coil and C2 domain-containing protein 2A
MLVAKNGVAFTKDELEQSKMMVYFTLFDQEVKVDQITKMNRLLQKQNRYLGSFKVPLTTILSNSKFEGLIKLQRPLILQDYHVVQDELIFMDKEDIEKQQNRNEEQIPTYINLSISIEPFIKLPMENDKDYYNGKEKANFLEACIQWAKATARPFVLNQRCFKLFLENIDGQSVFIPRFLSPIKPPDEIYKKDDSRAIERAARFVSLIPFMDDA